METGMGSSAEFAEYICDQLRDAGDITCKKMFGEYGVYCDGKMVALICDDQFFVKKTEAAIALLGAEAEEAPPYAGAKPYFLISDMDDRKFMTTLIQEICDELPIPVPKKRKETRAPKTAANAGDQRKRKKTRVHDAIREVRSLLLENTDAGARESGKRFFKGEEKNAVKLHGVSTAMVNKIAKAAFASLAATGKDNIFALCEELWQSGYIEESFIACEWSYAVRKQYAPADIRVFEKWLGQHVNNWASCDTLCNHSMGTLVEMYPELSGDLLRWAESDHRWLKRGAAVSLIIPARKGLFGEEIFAIAEKLLADPDDMVQKGYGWMLKAASEARPKEIFAYLMEKRAVMPRTAFRYALEKCRRNGARRQ
jgi:3-methyladenine DNA glycosylase AlkD/TfoX/Sxy family transcriptional regulator of competence genes